MNLSSAQKMYDADAAAIHVWGVPSTLLMTNAARHVAQAAQEIAGGREAVIFCGSGNNGGDGVACAMHLLRRGLPVRALLVGSREKMTEDTREMERRLIELGGSLEDFNPDDTSLPDALRRAGVIVDAMFGIGLARPLAGRAARAVSLINAAGVPVIAADIPSGVSADTGEILGCAVRADQTITFSMAKPGQFLEPGCTCCGRVKVVDIGIPREVLAQAGSDCFTLDAQNVSLPRRPRISHKGDYGRLLILGGSVGYTGAPSLCAAGALRSGAGLVYMGVPRSIYAIIAAKNDAAMPFPLPDDAGGHLAEMAIPDILARLGRCDVCVAGPGLGRTPGVKALVEALITQFSGPLLLDADALWALGELGVGLLQRARGTVILTPHDGELARLGPLEGAGRLEEARTFAQKYGCVLIRKGHRTLCAFPDGEVTIATVGNPGMARGGSGDVLAGILGALLGQLPLKRAVNAAVWLHGRAGDLAAAEKGEYGMLPTDLIGRLPAAELEIQEI